MAEKKHIKKDMLEKIYNESVDSFNKYGVSKTTESDFSTRSAAHHTIKGINIAQYILVAPLIEELMEHLPKPTVKEIFKKVCQRIGETTEAYLDDKENLDVAIYHNRERLKQIGIPREQWKKYGGEYFDG